MEFPFKRRPLLPPPPQPKPEKKDKCEIIIKKGKDGSLRKQIKGNCTRQQLEALTQINTQDLDGEDN